MKKSRSLSLPLAVALASMAPLAGTAVAQDQTDVGCCGGDFKQKLAALVATAAGTTSPFPPPEEKLGVYVINSGSGLDTGCTYRSGGPLIVQLPVPATVNDNEIGADGKLKDPAKLVASGVIGATVNVRFPVFDIDSGATNAGIAPEIDYLSFNGRRIKTLSGINNTWTDDSFTVPIAELKFVSPASPSATNELRVEIDQGNIGNGEQWCMAIDWLAVEFECAAPYVLVHGIGGSAATWSDADSPGVLTTLNEKGVVYTLAALTPHGPTLRNGRELLEQTRTFLEARKADKVHLIAHSKGGLDSQAMESFGPPFKILSLSTISTPHLGSVASDLGVIRLEEADERINSGADPSGYVKEYLSVFGFTDFIGQAPKEPGIHDLTTQAATNAIQAGRRGNISPTFTFGASADLNNNNDIEANESAGLVPSYANFGAQAAWRVMRDFASARRVSVTNQPGRLWGKRKVLIYQTVQTASPQPNDIVVTLASANPSYGTPVANYGANHSTAKDGVVITEILDRTIPLR